MDKVKKEKIIRTISWIVLWSFFLPIGFLVLKLISPDLGTNIMARTRGDYALMLVQCLLGILVLVLPSIISKKKQIEIPSDLFLLYVIFLFCAIFLGEVRNFYYKISYWDMILHAFSGGMISALGFSFISLLNNDEKIHLKLSPFFVAAFAFTFSITLGVVWEVYEYTLDGLLGLNMQKFALESGAGLIGREALTDTMQDLIVDGLGAFIISIIGYISLKYDKGWLERLIIKKKKIKNKKDNL